MFNEDGNIPIPTAQGTDLRLDYSDRIKAAFVYVDKHKGKKWREDKLQLLSGCSDAGVFDATLLKHLIYAYVTAGSRFQG